ncbi:MAG: DUF362 domain-containing protein [Deltaproteobacteria bacterium]|nr:DUF362 domain-containing protein [Deltaproteobacteria bacterium]
MRDMWLLGMILALCFGIGGAPLWAAGAEKPVVAILKATDHELVGESFLMNWDRVLSQGINRTRKIDYCRAEWSRESEQEIETLVRDAVEIAGGWPVKTGDVVLIKPNLVVSIFVLLYHQRTTEDFQACLTDPRIVRALALMAKESGAKRIIVGVGPAAGDGWAGFMQSGYLAMVEELKARGVPVELIDFTNEPYTWVKSRGLANPEYAVPKVVTEVNRIISVPALKNHSKTGVTLSLKNVAAGLMSGRAYGFYKFGCPHEAIPAWISDVASMFKIDYAVVDGIWGMEGNGPISGEPVPMDLIVAGADPVAVDAVCTAIMGFDPRNIGHITEAARNGLGVADLDKILVEGDPIASVAKPFAVVPEGSRWPPAHGGVYKWEERLELKAPAIH